MDKELYNPYKNKNGKLVSGTASLNHYIHTVKGGVQNYNDEIGAAYISEFVKEHSDIINAGLAKKPNETDLKLSHKYHKGGVSGSSIILHPIQSLLPPWLLFLYLLKNVIVNPIRIFFHPFF